MKTQERAGGILGSVHIALSYEFEGEGWLEIPVRDWDDVMRLPGGLVYEARQYGRTGWNSDAGVAYYSTRKKFAIAIA